MKIIYFLTIVLLVREIFTSSCDESFLDTLPGQLSIEQLKNNEYPTPWADKEYACKAVRFERRLELGLEGHRHFDLVRWGVADQVINAYMEIESQRPYKTYLSSFSFVKGKHEYFSL